MVVAYVHRWTDERAAGHLSVLLNPESVEGQWVTDDEVVATLPEFPPGLIFDPGFREWLHFLFGREV